MHRAVVVIAVVLAAAAGPAPARAQEAEAVEAEPTEPGVSGQELGAHLGLRLGGRTTPGGLRLHGSYLYQLTDAIWSESGFGVTVGSGAPACFRDRSDDVICDHPSMDGRGVGVWTGLRYLLPGRQGFVPYAQAGIGVDYVNYPDDEVSGFAFPLVLGAGTRVRVTDDIAVGGGAQLTVGIARLGRDVGVEPQAALTVAFGAEFALE